MSHTVSDNEWTLMQIMEKAIVPLFVAGIIGGFVGWNQISAAQAATKTEIVELAKQRAETADQVKAVEARQNHIINSQHTIEVTVKEVQTNQKHIQNDINDIKSQNREILRILQKNGHGID